MYIASDKKMQLNLPGTIIIIIIIIIIITITIKL